MKIEISISSDEYPLNPMALVLLLPRGCGLDFAQETIEKVKKQISIYSMELFIAHTEGRHLNKIEIVQ